MVYVTYVQLVETCLGYRQLRIGWACVWWRPVGLYRKGIVQRDYLPLFFQVWFPSYLLTRYLKAFRIRLWIQGNLCDFDCLPLVFLAESQCSLYYLVTRVTTSRIVYSGEFQMYEFFAKTLTCLLIWRVNTPHIVSYGESLLHASFIARSHSWQQGVF
jgi:hypothetical protein